MINGATRTLGLGWILAGGTRQVTPGFCLASPLSPLPSCSACFEEASCCVGEAAVARGRGKVVLCQHQAAKKVRSCEFPNAWSGRGTSHILLAGRQSRSPTYPQRRLGDGALLCAQDEKAYLVKSCNCLPWRGEMMSQGTQQAKSEPSLAPRLPVCAGPQAPPLRVKPESQDW